MNNFKFTIEDYILYLLNKLQGGKADKIKLNKVAFFTEFGYIFKNQSELSEADYAAIDKGPIIDNYSQILESMEKKGLIKIDSDGYTIRALTVPSVVIPKKVSLVIDPIIGKYSQLTDQELISLSHDTDSYKITTDNEKMMGNKIDKDLASLETFFVDEDVNITEDEERLPVIDKTKLVEYEFGQ